jgi:predicted short-subunit dehydrogenase-like oxidoreductase (DUF2520 family)
MVPIVPIVNDVMRNTAARHARIAFVGAGPVAATLARAMRLAGLQVAAMFSRDHRKAADVAATVPGAAVAVTAQAAADAADIVFLTVPDDAIETVCAGLVWRAGHSVVHCSGATELDALRHARHAGASTGAFHPLQMFANPSVSLDTLAGCTVTIVAETPLAGLLEDICRGIRCRPVRLPPGQRALYHASANFVGPFLIALMQEAVQIWRALGISEHDALVALVPLLEGTVAAVMDGGLAQGMGGCVARGDVGTVGRHLTALDAFSPEMAALYRQLTIRTIPLGLARGSLSSAAADKIRAVLEVR